MVNVGFICEGDTEVKIVKSDAFQALLSRLGLRCVFPIQDATGNGNLLPHNISNLREVLLKNGADYIIILTDKDDDACITLTRQRIGEYLNQYVIVSARTVESWFLADSVTMTQAVGENFQIEYPEQEQEPFEAIRRILIHKTHRGVGTKPILAQRMIKNGFTIERAAAHENCPSARYFLRKLQTLASAN